jgi:hypothetical protein
VEWGKTKPPRLLSGAIPDAKMMPAASISQNCGAIQITIRVSATTHTSACVKILYKISQKS